MVKVCVASPQYGGMCSGGYAQGCLSLQNMLTQIGVEASWAFLFNESLITRARNNLAHGFLKTDFTHLFFIDADIHFSAPDALAMLAFSDECPIICGIYPKKEIDWHQAAAAMSRGVPIPELRNHTGSFVINLKDYAGEVTVPINRPAEVWNGGTGFMLISREVFETMKPHVPTFRADTGGGSMQPGERVSEFFATSIEPGTERLLSEDYHFCSTWRRLGGKVYCAPWARLGHLGSYLFEGQLLRS